MAADEARIRALAEEYEVLKERQQVLLAELSTLQQKMGEIMLQIIDVTRE
jgi:predicted  nucleic acid-binding Zn-ribbon protein